jgi:hypothetical protein
MAIQVSRGVWRRYCLRDRIAHPTRKQETGETASLTLPLQFPEIHWRNSAHIEQSAETVPIAPPSQVLPELISWCDQMAAVSIIKGEFPNSYTRAMAPGKWQIRRTQSPMLRQQLIRRCR